MKNFYIIFITFAIFSGCSSNETTKSANGNTATNTINANNSAAVNQNQPTVVPYNGIENLDPNAFNANISNVKQVNRPVNSNQRVDSRTAPDNSTVSVKMDKNGNPIETRTFLNHQILEKVEKISIGKNVKYKVYLKNGKVIEPPADKMENFTALAPNNILAAIGIEPPPPRPEERVPEMKKPQQ
jgi:hypothetical protein